MSILSPQSQILPNAASILCSIPLLLGINGLLRPRELLASVEFPTPAPESQPLVDTMTRLYATRNIVMGSLCLAIRYSGNRKLFGGAIMIVSFCPLIDAFLIQNLIGHGSMNHLPLVPIMVGIGAGLLGWLG